MAQSRNVVRPGLKACALLVTIGVVGALLASSGTAFADLPVGSDQDTVGPEIASFSFAPTTVDVTATSAQVDATAHLTDDLSGVDQVSINYRSPSGFQFMTFRFFSSQLMPGGTAQDGMYESALLVETYREAGVWTVASASTTDAVGNTRSYTAAEAAALGAGPLTVGSNPDTTLPSVTAVRWSPAPLDVSAADGTVTFEWDIEDEGGSGAWIGGISLTSPSGRQSIRAQGVDSGSVAQGAVTVSAAGLTSTRTPPYQSFEPGLSRFSEPGIWTVNYVQVYDRAHNVRTYVGAELDAILPDYDFLVIADPVDVGAPSISEFRFSPTSIDVSTAPASVNVELDVHDELSGVQSAWVRLQSPAIQASPPFIGRYGTWSQSLTALRILDGTVTGRIDFPTYDRSGTWTVVELCAVDRVKHEKCYTGDEIAARGQTTFTVVANEPPHVAVTGVVDDGHYSQHPTAGCQVVDREDGTITDVEPVRTGPVDGVFTVTCTYTDHGGKTGTASVTYRLDAVGATSNLKLTKEGPATANAGEELTYKIRVKNNGPDVATNVIVNDTLPAGLDLVSTDPDAPACQGNVTIVCNLGTLPVGQTAVATIVARAQQPGDVNNEATASSDSGDPDPDDNTGGWGTSIGSPPDFGLAKGVEVLPGPRLRYTIDVENLGPTTAYGVVAKDILDPEWTLLKVETTKGTCDGRVVCAIGTMAVGDKETVTIEIGVTVATPVHNDVELTWYGGGIKLAGATSPGLPKLIVSKAHVGNFFAGGIGTYTATVSNIGSGPTTTDIVVKDTLPEGMTFVSGSGGDFTCEAVGQLVTCTRSTPLDPSTSANFTLTVDIADDAPRSPVNIIEVGGGGGFVPPEPSSDPGAIVDPPVLGVSKTVKERVVRIGHDFTYLIDVTNTGDVTATNVRVIDTLPGSVDLVSVTPGAPTCTGTTTITCTLGDLDVDETVTVEIIVKPREITLLTNEAFAWGDGLRPVSSGKVATKVEEPAVLEIEKTADEPVVLENALLRYTIVVKNLGPGDTTNVKINDPLPLGVKLVSIQPDVTRDMTCNVETPPEPVVLDEPVVCTVPLLPEFTTSRVVITVQVIRIGQLPNTAGASSDDTDPVTGNPTSTSTVFVAHPDVSIAKTTNGDDGVYVRVGSPVTWRYHVVDTGNVDLTNVVVTDNKLAASAISCAGGSNVIATLAVGGSVDCIATGTATLGAYSNIGTARGTPPLGGDVTATDPSSYIGISPALSIVKTTNGSDGPVLWAGDPVTWRYRVTNTGSIALTNVAVTDNRVAASSISCAGGSNVIATLPKGSSVDCIAIGTAVAGAYTNIGTARATPPAGPDVIATDASSYKAFTTGLTAPTATTCQQFAAHTSPTLDTALYGVSKGKIGSIAPGVFFYYSRIVVSSSTPKFVVQQSNDAGWKPVAVQQAILWDASCAKTKVVPTVDAVSGTTTFDTAGLRAGTYFISVKYDPGAIMGRSVSQPYPTVAYRFGTYLGGGLYLTSGQVVTVKPKTL